MALAVAIGSYAWACTLPGSHSGTLRICNLNVNCSQSVGSPLHSQNYSANAFNVTPNISYDVREVAGDHRPDTDTACDLTGTIIGTGFLTTAAAQPG